VYAKVEAASDRKMPAIAVEGRIMSVRLDQRAGLHTLDILRCMKE
jgi:hypothetical protein